MKYSLRSLMIVVLVLPPLLAGVWWAVQSAAVPIEKAADDFGPPQLEKAIAAYEEYLRTHPDQNLPNSSAPAPNPTNP